MSASYTRLTLGGEPHIAIPVAEYEVLVEQLDLRTLKPIGWYLPGEAATVIHSDGSVEMRGVIREFDPDCCYRGCDGCETYHGKKSAE